MGVKGRRTGERTLNIADAFGLSLRYVTSTDVVLARKRTGKSYYAQVLAEELLDAGQQIIAIDPTSAWWGLRSSADGRGDGYPIVIIGGAHGDIGLEPTAGETIADAVIAERFSCVLDTSDMGVAEEQRFVAAFLSRLYRKNHAALHLFVDEADVFAPQRPFGEEMKTLHAMQNIVRRGGIKGIGSTMITQRPQVLNKDVLSQADMLTTLQMNHPKDLGAIEAWVSVHGDPAKAKAMMTSLPSLPRGHAWVWAPASDVFERIEVRRKRTFDSGKTPDVKGNAPRPRHVTRIDLKRLGTAIAATVEKAKLDDPRVLRARIVELEAAARRPGVRIESKTPVTMIAKRDIDRLTKLREQTDAALNKAVQTNESGVRAFEQLGKEWTRVQKLLAPMFEPVITIGNSSKLPSTEIKARIARLDNARATTRKLVMNSTSTPTSLSSARGTLSPSSRKILDALAWFESIGQEAVGSTALAFLSGYTVNGRFTNLRGELRTLGLIEYPADAMTRLTDEGRAHAVMPETPLTDETMQQTIRERLEPSSWKLIEPLLVAYPGTMTNAELAEVAGYTVNGRFTNLRGRLKTLGLVTYPADATTRAADLFFSERS